MRITGFEVEDFKGIRKANLRFAEHDTARVHTLVGLNESGKTTLLEALHAFSPDAETELVVKSALTAQQQREQRVPRDRISNFSGRVATKAFVEASVDDWQEFARHVKETENLTLSTAGLPTKFTFTRYDEYTVGDHKGSFFNAGLDWGQVKAHSGRAFRNVKLEDVTILNRRLHSYLPTIAYYPTFVFGFPEKIYLTSRVNSPINTFYRQLFQDILDFDGNGHTIEDSIVARLQKTEYWPLGEVVWQLRGKLR